jgi:translation initiation factor 4B
VDDDYDSRPRRGNEEKIVLPTAPRASLGSNIDDDRIPREPPFTAYIANLSYDINPEDVYKFFDKVNITNVRLQREDNSETGRLKGYGYADFADRNSLVEALQMNEYLLKNRKIKIDVSNSSSGDRRGNDRYGNRDGGRYNNNDRYNNDDNGGEDRTTGDWRSGGGLPAFRDDGRGDRNNDRGGGRYQDDRRSYERGN